LGHAAPPTAIKSANSNTDWLQALLTLN
jgi:hypothetical protein